MKKLMLTLTVVMLTFFAVNAQTLATNSPTIVQNNQNGAEITFTNLVHDYGTIQKGGDGNCVFTFSNTGKEPLILTNVTTSCGCTVPSWTKEPILPGKTGIIKVTYTRTNTVGNISKQITVISNAKNGTIVLSIKGNVVDNTSSGTTPEETTNEVVSPQ